MHISASRTVLIAGLGAVMAAGLTLAALPSSATTLDAAAPAAAATPTTPPAAYPNPGVVTGDTGVHDPTIVKRPDGGYLLAHTGNGISLKTSADHSVKPFV